MANENPPTVVSMLLCDQIIIEQGTNKKSLIGVFDSFYALKFPAPIPHLGIYAKFADAEGDYSLKLRLVNLRDESVVFEATFEMKAVDATQYSDLVVNLGIGIPEPGKYEFQLYSGEDYLHRITMGAILMTPSPEGGNL